MPCNNSHRYIRYQRVFLVQSVILKDPVTLYFHAGSIVHDFLIPCVGIERMTPFLLYRDLYFRQRHCQPVRQHLIRPQKIDWESTGFLA